MLVDSHCHLNFPEFKEDIDKVIANAADNQVKYMLTVNTRLSETLAVQSIAEKYKNVFCSVGVHPHDSKDYNDQSLINKLISHSSHPKVVALGETGLDYYYNNSDRDDQINCFKMHLEAGTKLDMPVIIHTRNADEDTIACLNESPNAKGVFHCFSGSSEFAKQGLDHGLYISFSGIITFKKAEDLRAAVNYVPLERMLVETDSQFLAPLPHRGKRNEPAFTRYVAELVADIKGVSFEEVAEVTTNNFFKLFNRAKASE
ncbi:MAG: TatD family hydrolase [Alphaproteobacteria bacterium]